MKFEHTAALMLQSTAINADRTKRAIAESIPVPDAREIAWAEFESAKHEISDAQYAECLDHITLDLNGDETRPLVIRHDVPLMRLPASVIGSAPISIRLCQQSAADKWVLSMQERFRRGLVTLKDFCGEQS